MAKPNNETDTVLVLGFLALTYVVGDVLKQLRKLRDVGEQQGQELGRLGREVRGQHRPDAPGEVPPDVVDCEVIEDERPAAARKPAARKRPAARAGTSPDIA